MNINEKFCLWLGFKYEDESFILKIPTGIWIARELPSGEWDIAFDTNNPKYIPLDFLHDRNQQKWIIDELIKKGYRIKIYISEYSTRVYIWHNDNLLEFLIENDKIDDSAFIHAVEQLIDKEETK